jgi:hypothetical protein
MVCGEPCNSKTGNTWAMGLISSIEEALSCKYPLICSKNDKKLISLFNKKEKHKQKHKEMTLYCNPLDPNSTLNMDRGGIKSSRAKWTTAKVLPLKKIIKKY